MEVAFTISMIVLFLHATSWEGHIFEGIKKIVPPKGKWYKALYGCPICMTPWWGSLVYFLFFFVTWQHWLVTVGAAAGINVISVCVISLRKAAVTYFKQFEDK